MDLNSLGTINSRPYYQFTHPGTGQTFRIYFDIDTDLMIKITHL